MSNALETLLESAREAARTGGWDEAIERYETALPRLARAGEVERAASTLRSIGHMRFERGALEAAGELFEASLAIAEANGLAESTAMALNGLAVVEQFAGRVERAVELYERARGMAEECGSSRLVAIIDQNLGTLASIRGDRTRAIDRYRSALERFRGLGDDLSAAQTLNNLAMAQLSAEQWDDAEASFDRAFSLADRVQDPGTVGNVEINRAELHLRRGNLVRAREHCDRAFEIFGRIGSRTGQGEAHRLYGALTRQAGKPYLAEMHLLLAVELARGSGDRLLEAEVERERALAATSQGRDREALECLARARRLFTELEARRDVVDLERRIERLEKAYLEIVERWSDSIEATHPALDGHARRVAALAERLAAAAGLDARERTAVRVGALLHDVGKTALPAGMLERDEPLGPAEREALRRHPAEGERMIAQRGLPWDVRAMVRAHHEHWDGTGYPERLRGSRIPRGARILRIADAYDHLAGPRSYRPALPAEEALRVMERDAGRTLDPDLFRLFRDALVARGDAPAPGIA